MHVILLKTVQDLGGKGATGDIIRKLEGLRDKRIYSALDAYAKNGYLEKTQPSGKSKNVWVITKKGALAVSEATNNRTLQTLSEYSKAILKYRAANEQPSKKKNYRSIAKQKDLLEPTVKPVKAKAPESDIGPMSQAANAAVEGIAALVEENQRNTALLKNIYNQLHAIFGNQQ
jgi:DNA-binding PadR family transcriptional regulator